MPAPPQSTFVSTIATWQRFLKRFPDWIHPVVNGAAIVTVLVAIRVLFALPRGPSWGMLAALALGAVLGAFGGLSYSALRPYIAAGGARRVLAYLLVVASYLALGFALLGVSDAAGPRAPAILFLLAVGAVVFVLWLAGRRRSS